MLSRFGFALPASLSLSQRHSADIMHAHWTSIRFPTVGLINAHAGLSKTDAYNVKPPVVHEFANKTAVVCILSCINDKRCSTNRSDAFKLLHEQMQMSSHCQRCPTFH